MLATFHCYDEIPEINTVREDPFVLLTVSVNG
jgi:hypothetical protein